MDTAVTSSPFTYEVFQDDVENSYDVWVELPADMVAQGELLDTDGEPLDSDWHRLAMNVLIESLRHYWRHRNDFYVGGNMFIYFGTHARRRAFRGPDFFFVNGVSRTPMRRSWVVQRKGGRSPDVIIELLSPRTATADRTTKKAIYEQEFRTPEYYCYDLETQRLEGWQLREGQYQPMVPNAQEWLWSEQLQLWVGPWTGTCFHNHATWLCFYNPQGYVVPLPEAAERQRAEAAEAELARLRARLTQMQGHEPGASAEPSA